MDGYIFAGTQGAGMFRSVQATTAIEKISIESTSSFALKQNFPNPFNSTTQINYVAPMNSPVELTGYNLWGQKIKTLVRRK